MTKRCRECGGTKSTGEFWRNPGTIDGLQAICKKCASAYNKRYYTERRERLKARTRQWHRDNPERSRAQAEKFRRDHPHYARERYRRNPAYHLAAVKASRERDIAAFRAKQRANYRTNIEHERERGRNYQHWKRNNPDRRSKLERDRQAKKKANGGTHTIEQWRDIKKMALYGCLCCGLVTRLQADHIIPVKKNGTNDIWNIQPLCGPCNFIKHTKSIDYRPREMRIKYRDPEWTV